jgi:phenylacetate-CoA ligase
MKLIRGTNVYPRAVESIVREFDAIDEFQIYISREGIRDEIAIKLELKPGREGEWPALETQLKKALADAHEGLHFLIVLMEPNSLPRFELKAKRLMDVRPVAVY